MCFLFSEVFFCEIYFGRASNFKLRENVHGRLAFLFLTYFCTTHMIELTPHSDNLTPNLLSLLMNDTEPPNVPSYHNHKRVLLLGEADYSFSRAFAKEFSNKEGHDIEITATEFGDGPDISSRYHDGDMQSAARSMSSLSHLMAVHEVISDLNARLLGDAACTCQRWNDKEQDWDLPSSFWKRDATNNGSCNGADSSTFFDLIIFNFPHSEQAGRATRLVRALFKQLRICIDDGRLPKNVVLEMRLRRLESDPNHHLKKNVRALYNHEEAAEDCQFELIESWPSDLQRWENLGYAHKWTKRNATCRDIGLLCKVWRWRSAT